MISIIIIVPDRKAIMPECMSSVKWADEVLVIETNNIKGSFSDWRNVGLAKAKGDWIFYVDSDEVVTPGLRSEVERAILEFDNVAYAIPRRNYIFGREFHHCGQYPDYQRRLFKKTALHGWKGNLHEEPEYEGRLGYLKNSLIHYKQMTLSQMIEKTNFWSEIEAKLMFDAHHPPMNLARFGSAIFRELWLRLVVQMAFLDGIPGLIYGLYQVFSRFVSYSKLAELQLKNESRSL